ncbi:SoxR reducing system RseC family protein [Litoribaculum gwangyangense]|uniref:Fis family transcriptional regulator n=1 Tax=Litoribaculum gwangyangense TaxID=1130722 RepID=A0ABP9C550_9FLAO
MGSHQKNKDIFVHSGFISKISSKSIFVTLEENVHCESCHAKGSCGVSGSSTKEIEVLNSKDSFKINEHVNVVLKKTLGLKAVFFAYLLPFTLMFLTLIIASNYLTEWMAGILALSILIPYYIILYFLKNTHKRIFEISILKT